MQLVDNVQAKGCANLCMHLHCLLGRPSQHHLPYRLILVTHWINLLPEEIVVYLSI
jgi:hypothetical protein